MHFKNRIEAGQLLATMLVSYANQPHVIVLALPRGGVPVAAQVAKQLHAPLDVLVVRKLGLPSHPELAMGAIAGNGVRVLNREVLNQMQVCASVIEAVSAREQQELERREQSYRVLLPPLQVDEKTVILVDDGIATGSSMLAAVAALREMKAGRIVIATPTVSPATYKSLREKADDVIAILVPEEFYGVGQWYEDFAQTTDEEVQQALAAARQENNSRLDK